MSQVLGQWQISVVALCVLLAIKIMNGQKQNKAKIKPARLRMTKNWSVPLNVNNKHWTLADSKWIINTCVYFHVKLVSVQSVTQPFDLYCFRDPPPLLDLDNGYTFGKK